MDLAKSALVLSVISIVASAAVFAYSYTALSSQSENIAAVRSATSKIQSDVASIRSTLNATVKSLQTELGTFREATGITPEQAELLEKARQEKTVLIYTVVDPPVIEKYIIPAFQAAYPWASIQIYSAGTGQIVNRILAEQQAKTPKADVVQVGEAAMRGLIKQGFMVPFKSSSEAAFPTEFVDPQGYFHGGNIQLDIGMYNSNLVKSQADLPKTWAEFPNIKWKGKLILQEPSQLSTVGRLFVALEKLMGTASWREWLQKTAALEPPLVRSASDVFTKVGTGEYTLGIAQASDILTNPDAPVKPLWMDGAFASVTGLSLAKDAPHPSLAKLFIQWLQTPHGQNTLAQMGRTPVLSSIESPYSIGKIVPSGVKVYNEGQLNPELFTNPEKYQQLFTEIFKPGR